MPKKKKTKSKTRKKVLKKTKSKTRKKVLKKTKSKTRKKVLKKTKSKTRKKVLKKTKFKVKKKFSKKTENKELIFKTKPEWAKSALVNKAKYQKKYSESIKNNNEFWKKEGKRITWIKSYKKIKNVKYSKTDVRIKWYEDGTLNASSNCIDRHLKDKKDKTAIIWVGDDPNDTKKISYKQLHSEVSKLRMV